MTSTEYNGYLYVHFKRESADGEQIYFALSDGNDPLQFRDLNGGEPVLYSTLGERGVRDPHIVRSPDGDRFSGRDRSAPVQQASIGTGTSAEAAGRS